MNLAVAQIERKVGDINLNTDVHIDMIEQAKSQNVDLLVFPELSLVGYAKGAQKLSLAMSYSDERLKNISKTAPDMIIHVGFIEVDENHNLYNSMACLKDGQVQSVHRKLNLPHYGNLCEKDYFQEGDYLNKTQLKFANKNQAINLHQLICADMWNPAIVHCAMLDKPDLMVTSICSLEGAVSDLFVNSIEWPKTLAFYSMIYATPIVMANYVDVDDANGCWGGSSIYDAYGKERLNTARNVGVFSAEINLKENNKARKQLPTIRDSNTPLISNLLNER